MHRVPFITVEDEDPDMIVSFALGPNAEHSLTLLRTPKYESLLDDWDRGVTVGGMANQGSDRELLTSLQWLQDRAVLTTDKSTYLLDLSDVDPEEVDEAKLLLAKMNFDNRFSTHAA